MLKLNIPNLEAIRNWCNEKFQPKGNYITKSEISNEVNETEITLSDLSETVPEAISAMSEEKKLKNLLSHIKAFMTGSKALIDLCVTTGMITQQNINDENKVPSAALLYSLNDALNGQVAQINSNLEIKVFRPTKSGNCVGGGDIWGFKSNNICIVNFYLEVTKSISTWSAGIAFVLPEAFVPTTDGYGLCMAQNSGLSYPMVTYCNNRNGFLLAKGKAISSGDWVWGQVVFSVVP